MQQINLYLPEFQPNREPLRSIHMLFGLIVFLTLLIVINLLSINGNRERAAALEISRLQLEQLKLTATTLEQQRPQSNVAELDTQIHQLQQDLQRREQIFGIIANKNLGNNTGFSAHLHALGKQSLETISLTAFSLQQGGGYVEFAGETAGADQVPLYIQRLRSDAAFVESAFGVLNLEPSKKALIFDFSLAQESDNTPALETKTSVQRLLELKERELNERESPLRGAR